MTHEPNRKAKLSRRTLLAGTAATAASGSPGWAWATIGSAHAVVLRGVPARR